MTDESMALFFGWVRKQGRTIAGRVSHYWTFPNAGRGQSQKTPPAYTTDVNLLIREINRLGLNLHLHQWPTKWEAALYEGNLRLDSDGHWGKTPALAICDALRARRYLLAERKGEAMTPKKKDSPLAIVKALADLRFVEMCLAGGSGYRSDTSQVMIRLRNAIALLISLEPT